MDDLLYQIKYMFVSEEALILAAIFMAVVFLVLGGFSVLSVNAPMSVRLRLSGIRGAGGRSLRYGMSTGRARHVVRRLERSLSPKDDRKRSAVRRRLLQAGFYDPGAVTVYYAVRVVLALGLPVAAMLVTPMVMGTQSISTMYVTAMGAVAVGFFGPAFLLTKRIETRQRAVRESFPDALDMMLVCVEAGLGLNAAIVRVADELDRAHPLLCEHFRIVGLEMQAGASREAALRNLAERIGLEEMSAFVSVLIQSDAMGVSISQTLRVYASEMRRKRLILAEEHANKLPVRMVMPLAGLIMPGFIIVITIPTVIRILRILLPALAGEPPG